ncbi:MAG: high-affinity nickel-transport family protein [Candidatus Binataceae bacterium]|nr:high-affinity nickel-transport family protein [Candidatus Binataceae bacterium]
MDIGNAAPLGIALLGLLLGMRHATDPDHVVAVTTILSREHRIGAAARVGIIWGLGHTLTVLLVGAVIIIFKIAIPVRLGLAMEFAVAVVLILLGAGAASTMMHRVARHLAGNPIRNSKSLSLHSHPHAHSDAVHGHRHLHLDPHDHHASRSSDAETFPNEHNLPQDRPLSFAARRPLLRSFSVGLVHGLAGSAAIALLVLAAIPQPLWATLYLAIFCAGTIIGMGLITTAIAAPFIMASRRMSWLHQGFVTSAGLLSFGFGLFLAYQIGIVDRLFSSAPIWTPH